MWQDLSTGSSVPPGFHYALVQGQEDLYYDVVEVRVKYEELKEAGVGNGTCGE